MGSASIKVFIRESHIPEYTQLEARILMWHYISHPTFTHRKRVLIRDIEDGGIRFYRLYEYSDTSLTVQSVQ